MSSVHEDCIGLKNNDDIVDDKNVNNHKKHHSPKRKAVHPNVYKRRHRRSKRSSKNKVKLSECEVKVAFNNVNRVKPKIYEITRFLNENNISIMGVAETFLDNDECIQINGYKWVGKNRLNKGGGGVGFLVSESVCITEDNLCNSQQDEYERLWIEVKIGNDNVHIAVVYFPVQGTNPDLVNELYNQLLADVIQIENDNEGKDPHILIMGDFNGRIGDMIYGGDPVRNSNGELLLEFADHARLEIINCNRKCKGKITWFRHPHSSCIDYFLSSHVTEDSIIDMLVDEERHLNLGSDHNMLITRHKFKFNSANKKSNENKRTNNHWNISKDQDWSSYQNALVNGFRNLNPNDSQDVDSLWNNWKDNLINITSDVIGFKGNEKNNKQWWCKSIDDAIKERKQACKDHRRWSKHDSDNKGKGDQLWEDYKIKKQRVKTLIHQKMTQMRLERSVNIAKAVGPSSRDFWKNLRGTKKRDNLLALKLDNSDKVVTDRSVMKQSIMHYWHTLGKMDMVMNDNFNDVETIIGKIKNGESNVGLNTDVSLNNIVITHDDVKDAIADAKNNKSPGLDLITNELLKNGGEGMIDSLTKLFNSFLYLESTPHEWNKGIIVPIFKKGNKNDLNNYRGITLTSCVSKIFNRIIANCISNFVEDNNILSEIQGALGRTTDVMITCFLLKASPLRDLPRINKLIWPFWISEKHSTQCGGMASCQLLGILVLEEEFGIS
ncbi:uncharacterized protein [Amphiura filiformis]|uniref:uncharacterized protein n=1 Tax=Amphiura filiformis TaxID=82378 RepID=UPI003B215601